MIHGGVVRTPCDVRIMYIFRLFSVDNVCTAAIIWVIIIYVFFNFQKSHIQQDGMEIYLKKDYMQYTGKYKEIGTIHIKQMSNFYFTQL